MCFPSRFPLPPPSPPDPSGSSQCTSPEHLSHTIYINYTLKMAKKYNNSALLRTFTVLGSPAFEAYLHISRIPQYVCFVERRAQLLLQEMKCFSQKAKAQIQYLDLAINSLNQKFRWEARDVKKQQQGSSGFERQQCKLSKGSNMVLGGAGIQHSVAAECVSPT